MFFLSETMIPKVLSILFLTLKWLRYCLLPLGVKGGPMGPNSENTFHEGFFFTKFGTFQSRSKT